MSCLVLFLIVIFVYLYRVYFNIKYNLYLKKNIYFQNLFYIKRYFNNSKLQYCKTSNKILTTFYVLLFLNLIFLLNLI